MDECTWRGLSMARAPHRTRDRGRCPTAVSREPTRTLDAIQLKSMLVACFFVARNRAARSLDDPSRATAVRLIVRIASGMMLSSARPGPPQETRGTRLRDAPP